MSRLTFSTVFAVFVVLQLANAAPVSYYQDELHHGQCTGVLLVDDDVIKSATPYTVKKLTYTWKGYDTYTLTCINVSNRLNSRDRDTGSLRLIRGGVGDSEMVLEMTSQNGKGLNYHIEMYAELKRNYY